MLLWGPTTQSFLAVIVGRKRFGSFSLWGEPCGQTEETEIQCKRPTWRFRTENCNWRTRNTMKETHQTFSTEQLNLWYHVVEYVYPIVYADLSMRKCLISINIGISWKLGVHAFVFLLSYLHIVSLPITIFNNMRINIMNNDTCWILFCITWVCLTGLY